MNADEIRVRFIQAGLERLVKDLDALMKPAIRLVASPVADRSFKLGRSRLGGVPDLPVELQWPMWQGVPQAFIGQLNLEELHAYDVEYALPAGGMLWFFFAAQQRTYGASPDDLGSWSVIFRREITQLARRSVPPDLPTKARFKGCQLDFVPEVTLPAVPLVEIPDLDWSDEEQERYDDLFTALNNESGKQHYQHRVLGHALTLQDDMRQQCQLMSRGVRDIHDPRIALLAKGASNWRLLLQIDSDERTGMRWESAGLLYYWIRWPDCATCYFDETWAVVQSS